MRSGVKKNLLGDFFFHKTIRANENEKQKKGSISVNRAKVDINNSSDLRRN